MGAKKKRPPSPSRRCQDLMALPYFKIYGALEDPIDDSLQQGAVTAATQGFRIMFQLCALNWNYQHNLFTNEEL